ncbi:MAG: hypothetical protein IPO28_15330 [Holophagaceae bacterium]|nr:hypothetical protein [Holophagaceae bacterium]
MERYSLGTEMASTHLFPDQWRRLAADVRQVFKGKLVYSVNFDSHDSFTFGDCLDVIGINTYDPIAKYDDYPTPEQIRDAWWWIVYKARTLTARFQKPVMITEVGYPSVAHAHVGPWDFRTDKPLDLALQNLLLKGAFGVLRHWSDGDAVFYYLYGEHLNQKPVGGPTDRTYAVWGKPAEATLRKYFREPIWDRHLPPRAENIHEAVVQSLVSWHRKLRDYEGRRAAPLGGGLGDPEPPGRRQGPGHPGPGARPGPQNPQGRGPLRVPRKTPPTGMLDPSHEPPHPPPSAAPAGSPHQDLAGGGG